MAITTPLSPAVEWVELVCEQSDWDKADPTLLRTMISNLHLIRAFEEKVLELVGEGLVHGPAHSSIGEEGGAVGSILALRGHDQVNGSHRGHHQFLAKALNYAAPNGIDPANAVAGETRDILHRTLAEILGLTPGYCKGRGGSMHLRWAEAGALGTNAIVGGGVPLALGAAFAHKQSGTDAIAVSYFGEGAINIGSVLESFNLAAAWKLPVLFFVENNRYAVATHIDEVTAEHRVSARGPGFGIRSWRVDGMDPLAVHMASRAAVTHIRGGGGPALVEADVYRYLHQSGTLPGSAFGYRTKQEEEEWKKRDPLACIAGNMIRRGLMTEEGVQSLRNVALQTMAELADELTERAEANKRRIRPSLWPLPDLRDVGIRGDLSELKDVRVEEEAGYRGRLENRKFVDTIADVTGRCMETDTSIVVLGEDVHRLKGGTNGATRGLKERFPDRVLGTPISEAAFLGLGAGMAMDGRYRPIVEFMYPAFLWVAADQVFNQAGKARHMFGGESPVPLVLRTKVAMGTGYGSQHSMDPAGIFATSAGWRIVAPSTAFDYVGLMNSALKCKDPVLVIEHVDLYQQMMPVAVDDFDYFIPLGKAVLRRAGRRATILTYLSMVHRTIEAADELELDVDIVDLRSLDHASLDWETVAASVKKTNNVIIVEQGARGTSWGGWLADEIQRRLFDWLDQPVQRVTGGEASPSISKVLERAAFAGREEVAAALRAFVPPDR
jgi:2-oxoisovalerate dehydrogenase E1 component